MDNGSPYELVYEKCGNPEAKERWEVGFAISDSGLSNVSFVNSISTVKGGRHVDVVLDQIIKKLEEKVNAKNKG
jgi:DNA topoisomerase-2